MTSPHASPEPYIFVSYTSRDRERVLQIVDQLQQAGVRSWLDQRSIAGATIYGNEIVEGIKHCAALVIMCTPAALQSRNVRQEIQLAWKYERPYLPLLLEDVTFPQEIEYWLEGWQWVKLHGRPAQEWLPQVVESLARFGLAVETQAARGSAAAAPAPAVAPAPVAVA